MENPIKIDDLGVPLFLETPILSQQKTANTKPFPQEPRLLFDLHSRSLTARP